MVQKKNKERKLGARESGVDMQGIGEESKHEQNTMVDILKEPMNYYFRKKFLDNVIYLASLSMHGLMITLSTELKLNFGIFRICVANY